MKAKARAAAGPPPVMVVLARVEQRLDRLDAGDAAVARVADLENAVRQRDAAVAAAEHERDQARRGRREVADRAARIEAELDHLRTERARTDPALAELATRVGELERERDAALARAAALEAVTHERDAADRMCRSLREQLGTAAQRIATLGAQLDQARAATNRAPPPPRPAPAAGPCRACAAAANEIAGLKAQINAEQTRKREVLQERDEARQQAKDAEARLRAAATAPAGQAEPGPFVLERDTGRQLIWWTGELAGGRPVTTRSAQGAKPLLTLAEAEAWLGQGRTFLGWRAAPLPSHPAREASS